MDFRIDSKDYICSFCNIYKAMNGFVDSIFKTHKEVRSYRITDVQYFDLSVMMRISVSYKTKSGKHNIDMIARPSDLLNQSGQSVEIYKNQLEY